MKLKQSDIILSTVTVFLTIALVPLVLSGSLFKPFMDSFADLAVTDYQYSKLLSDKYQSDTNIIVINTLGADAGKFVEMLAYVNQFNYKTIGFAELPDFSSSPELGEFFGELIRAAHSPVLPAELKNFDKSAGTYSFAERPEITGVAYGYTNLLKGKDKETATVRDFCPSIQIGNEEIKPLAIALAEKFDPEVTKRLAERGNSTETICYHVKLGQNMLLFDTETLTNADSTVLDGKIVLFGKINFDDIDGEHQHLLNDIYYTPLNDKAGGRAFPDAYAVEVQANILSSTLGGYFYNRLPFWIEVLIAVVICYLNILLYAYIEYKNEKLYEITSLALFVFESVGLLVFSTIMYHENLFEFNSTLSIFALALSSPVYEGYDKSIKPLINKAYYAIKKRFGKS